MELQDEVLVAETKDVRPFARLLRGIGIKHVGTGASQKGGKGLIYSASYDGRLESWIRDLRRGSPNIMR